MELSLDISSDESKADEDNPDDNEIDKAFKRM